MKVYKGFIHILGTQLEQLLPTGYRPGDLRHFFGGVADQVCSKNAAWSFLGTVNTMLFCLVG